MCGTDTEQALAIKSAKVSSLSPVNPVTRNNGGYLQNHQPQPIINLDHGDPTMYEYYWNEIGLRFMFKFTLHIHQRLSYFASIINLCWFLEPELEAAIRMVHNTVGNATVEDRYIVVGTGSSQLILAALYALSEPLNEPNPVSVVSAAPYYSSYPEITDHLRSGLFRWGGDASNFDADGPYIEMVTSPNNPDGVTREPVVNRAKGMLVHDLAYYWPQYTAITSPADHDIMLFTLSKCSGHAGSRIGWAIVKDKEVAKKMVKFIEINTIGVSKEAQLRAVNVLTLITGSCQKIKPGCLMNFFEHSRNLLAERWEKLRQVVNNNDLFCVLNFPLQYCNFTRDFTEALPAFAWMKCEEGMNCEELLRGHKIMARSGERFGSGKEYVRISMLGKDEEFDLFLQKLSTVNGMADENLPV